MSCSTIGIDSDSTGGPDLTFLALGGGVQSTTLYLLAVAGEIERPDVAIFADTQSEPPWVYENIWRLASQHGAVVPIRIVTAGSLERDVLQSRDGRSRFAALPLRVMSRAPEGHPDHGRPTLLRRQCTREYKIAPIVREVRRLLGLRKGQRAAGVFEVKEWIGISLDEVQRMRPSRYSWIESRWPLVELGMRRVGCVSWLERNGYTVPKRSACVFCPFHDDATWRYYRDEAPQQWARAVAFDHAIRNGKLRGVEDDAFVHSSLMPLDEAPIDDERDQLDLFGGACGGHCGV